MKEKNYINIVTKIGISHLYRLWKLSRFSELGKHVFHVIIDTEILLRMEDKVWSVIRRI